MLNNQANELTTEIEVAAYKAFHELFKNGEHFYYCSLITTGEGLPPCVVAWSYEALENYVKENKIPEHERDLLKWSYADSPYLDFGSEYFNNVKRILSLRPVLDFDLYPEEEINEFNFRISCMEMAMKQLDEKGLFGVGDSRKSVLINAEVMPPDYENTLRAIRLNPPESMTEWIKSLY